MPNLDDFFSRIQTDHTFYFQFRQNPEESLESYELSTEEQAAITEFREQLWTRLGEITSYWKTGCNFVLLGSGELEFNAAGALERPEVRSAIDDIRMRSIESDRLTPVLALIEQIG
jgi:hypothetical protein